MNEAGWVGLKAFPTNQQVEQGHCEGQSCLKISPSAVHDFLEMADGGQHGQYSFDNHALVVVERLTHLQVSRIASGGVKAMIGEHHRAIFEALDQGMKGSVMDIGRITVPANHLPQMIEQKT